MAAHTFSNRPLIAPDIAQAVVYMLEQPLNISVKAMDVVPSGVFLPIYDHLTTVSNRVSTTLSRRRRSDME